MPLLPLARPRFGHPLSPRALPLPPGRSPVAPSPVPPALSSFGPCSRWSHGSISASYRPRGFDLPGASPSLPATFLVPSFRPAPRVDLPLPVPVIPRRFRPLARVSPAPSLPQPPAPLELKLSASATGSMCLSSSVSTDSSASQAEQQYSALLGRWRDFLSELGSASALYTEAAASQNRDFLLDRAARKFAPSTLMRYFDAWLNWSSFCKLAAASPHDPPAGLLPDWLKSQSSRQGLATMQLRALAWFCKTAGLPKLQSCLCTPNLSGFLRRLAPHRASRKLASEPQLCPVLGEVYPGSAYESCRHLAFRVLTSLYLGFLALGRCYLVPPFPAALSAPIARFGGHLSPYEDYQAGYAFRDSRIGSLRHCLSVLVPPLP